MFKLYLTLDNEVEIVQPLNSRDFDESRFLSTLEFTSELDAVKFVVTRDFSTLPEIPAKTALLKFQKDNEVSVFLTHCLPKQVDL